MILSIIILLLLLGCVFSVVFGLLGIVVKLLFTATICLPIAAILAGIGIACCCTIILIPVGVGLLKMAFGALTLAF